MNRAREALEQGNTKFVARGENKEVFEEMKREFELAKNGEPESKRMKPTAPAAAPQEESDSSSDSSDSEQSSSHHEEEKSIEPVVETDSKSDEEIEELKCLEDEAHFVTEPAEATQPAKPVVPCQYDHEAAMAWQAEMQRKEAAGRAFLKTPEANRIYCMADCKPAPMQHPSHYKPEMWDFHKAQRIAEHHRIMKHYERECALESERASLRERALERERALLRECALSLEVAQQD